ncbi:hypothetical protein CROQUDRAFT_86897 [Cronartium quercuum f. sp. fusiforme G11]|uniref:Mei2-like C-terminal RNA recognition motif domain-containing protein n=1 Tax=Cronartium quercuum f. sp. fusiforme G11 TaxID=708437 RepID=A0A9P6NXY3_9BASI|nr:hypothetical protein CROQUDRAFT_86897 [Cronartium quercuum f. sp. fusiforme G11]
MHICVHCDLVDISRKPFWSLHVSLTGRDKLGELFGWAIGLFTDLNFFGGNLLLSLAIRRAPQSSSSPLPRLCSTETVLRGSPLANPAQPFVNNCYIPKPGGASIPIPPSSLHQPSPTTKPSTPALIKPDPVAVLHGFKPSKPTAGVDERFPPGLSPSSLLENPHLDKNLSTDLPTNDSGELHVMNDPQANASFRRRRSSVSLRNDSLRAGSPYDVFRSDTSTGESPRGSSPATKVHFSDTYSTSPTTPTAINSAVAQTHPAPSDFKKRASTGSTTHQMSKWLPPSTSVLAEALEEDSASSLLSRPRPSSSDVAVFGGLMTPPFTPLKKLDEQGAMQTPAHLSSPTDKRIRPQTSLITPPDTLPHQQLRSFSGSRGTSVDFLSDSDSNSPTRASPHPGAKPTTPGRTLASHLKQLALTENSRPRSSSNPTGPGIESNRAITSQRPSPTSNLVHRFGELEPSAMITATDYRKRSETISTSAAGAPLSNFTPEGILPRRVSVSNFQIRGDTPGRFGTTNRGGDVSMFPATSSSIFASNLPSALAFSHPPTPYAGSGKLDQGADLLSPQPHHPNASPGKQHINASPHSGSGQRQFTEGRQRYHTAPAEGISLNPGSPHDYCTSGSDFDGNHSNSPIFEGRREEFAYPNANAFHLDTAPSKYANSRLRPRSSTMAGVGHRRMLKKSLLSLRWNDEEIDEGVEGESPKMESNSSPGGKTIDSTQSSSSTEDVDSMMFQPAINPDVSRAIYERRASDTALISRLPAWNSSASFLTRYCKILGFAPKLLGSMKGIVRVRNAFARYGDLLDIYVDTLSPLGFILVGFHDVRSILHLIEDGPQELGVIFGSYLKFEPIQRHEVIHLTQDLENPILSTNEATLKLHFDDPRGIITHDVLTEYLTRYGELKVLKHVGYNQWHVEYFDDLRAEAAQKELITRDFADFQVSVSTLEGSSGPFATPRGPIGPPQAVNEHIPFNPAMNANVCMLPPTIRPPPSLINPTDPYANNGLLYRYMADPYTGNYVLPWAPPVPGPTSSPVYHQPSNPNIADSLPYSAPLSNPTDRFPPALQQHQHIVAAASHRPRAFPFPGVPPSNVIDLDRIECGSDPRTTCMIKNIPNKITDEMLFSFINEICPRGFDFLYLRMDFKARLNVGYAFINFLSVENVLKFAKSKLGVKWGVFLSEKTVQMCYASIQGKENLIEKFRNSAIMEEEESFRPKVYHSSGPLAGLPEPFPHANDLQRKARSQANAALSARPSMPSSIGANAFGS